MNGGKILKNESFAEVKKVSKIKEKTEKTKETEKTDKKDKTFISNETTKEIVRLLTNDLKEYSKFINDKFPVETTTMHVNKPISYYLGKS
jgi:adenylate kinase family enzyme